VTDEAPPPLQPDEGRPSIEDDDPFEGQGLVYEHRVGRAVLSALIVVLVITLVGWNLPRSVFGYELRDASREQLRPVVNRLALNQGWEVFAPNPSSTSVAVTAEVSFEDGSTASFEFPDGEPALGALREYRWRKWERRIRLDDNRGLWRPTADWIARELSEPDNIVVEVQLVRHWSRMEQAGVPGEVNEVDFDATYTYDEVP